MGSRSRSGTSFGEIIISDFLSKRAHTDSLNSEKHAKKEEALAKLKEGVKFDQVARDYSEDKAKQGELMQSVSKGHESKWLTVCV